MQKSSEKPAEDLTGWKMQAELLRLKDQQTSLVWTFQCLARISVMIAFALVAQTVTAYDTPTTLLPLTI